MTITCKALFGYPQTEIASLLRDRLSRCSSASLVVGFATVDGLAAIEQELLSPPTKLNVLVVGNGTFRAFDMMDRMQGLGVAPDRLRIHYGYTRPWKGFANTFQKYHPMLHSKIYYCEMSDGTASVFVGSSNLTHFALNGLNGEASVLLEGPTNDPEIVTVRNHIRACVEQSMEYKPSMKEALTWWTTQFIEGLRKKVNDITDDAENNPTILALAVAAVGEPPKRGEIIYFEMPAGLPQVRVNAAVHIFGFDILPPSPEAALAALHKARIRLRGTVIGIEEDTGAHELEADWEITGITSMLRRTPQRRYRPPRGQNTIQVRVGVEDRLKAFYEYLFRGPKEEWLPQYDRKFVVGFPVEEQNTPLLGDQTHRLSHLNLDPPEDGEFALVRGLAPKEKKRKGQQQYAVALERTSPESGSYILFSQRRRPRPAQWLSARRDELDK